MNHGKRNGNYKIPNKIDGKCSQKTIFFLIATSHDKDERDSDRSITRMTASLSAWRTGLYDCTGCDPQKKLTLKLAWIRLSAKHGVRFTWPRKKTDRYTRARARAHTHTRQVRVHMAMMTTGHAPGWFPIHTEHGPAVQLF